MRKSLLLLTFCLILHPLTARAETFYSYVNRSGCIVFSNYAPKSGDATSVKEIEIEREQDRPDLIQFDESRFNQFDPLIKKYGSELEVDFNLIKALILVESNFNPRAVSPKGARGLMQLMPDTARRYGVFDLFDPEENIRGGTNHLRLLIDMFEGDLELVLSAYNAGENLVRKLNRIPRIPETIKYVRKIVEIYGSTKVRGNEQYAIYTPGTRMFRYYDQNGVLTFTNIDPPADARPVK
ncbi:MAG TPA: lytic transglycosylase domain-containing protein [Acidobacteriota bacterium]|nr:lytic transglycosylase domain-containing protein [Acidobacteriota bacterium]HQF86878.1 lytic transglycosylase domain-containing protein [Acidobacteriota bacterium]HQG91324.1 lytic transglycosylase domain-containing protein [Acidobacteriota bacterium]HQK89491.1 lytic transglycosylase domain-containing protein [Acidobacteriota bacterium]